MAVANDYVTGTITLTNGSTTFTGTGTAWRQAGFRDGDLIYVDNLVAVIAPNSVSDPLIDSNTSGKLTRPWTGTTGARAYRMSYKPDGARVTAETRNLIELLSNGVLSDISSLTPIPDTVVGFDSTGEITLYPSTQGKPLVILVEGQSNAYLERAYSWTPPKNLKIWNYSKVSGNIGTAFISPTGTVMSLALAIGKKLAEKHPDREIYIINISLSGNPISAWLPGAAVGNDVWQETINNVPVALASIGVTKIDKFRWWQGESDSTSDLSLAYPANFETLMARFRTQTWFREDTETLIFGTTSLAHSGVSDYGRMNGVLQRCVANDGQRRKFFNTSIIPVSYWNDTTNIHMTGAGYELAGSLAEETADGAFNGVQQPFVTDTDKGGVIALRNSYKNYLINADFDIWQYGTTQTTSGYGSDSRWSNMNSVSTKINSRQAFTFGQTVVPGNPKYFSRTDVVTGGTTASYCFKRQSIEKVETLAGEKATVCFWMRAPIAARNICFIMGQYFGTGGSTTTNFGARTLALTTEWKRFCFTVDIPSAAGKTLGTGSNFLFIDWWFDAGALNVPMASFVPAQSGTYDIAHVSLVRGDVTDDFDPFEYKKASEVQAECDRYFEVVTVTARYYASNASQVRNDTIRLVKKARVPNVTVTFTAPINNNVASLAIDSFAIDSARFELISTGVGDTYSLGGVYGFNAEL